VLQALADLVDELKKEGIGGTAVAAITINITGGIVPGSGRRMSLIDPMSFGIARGHDKR
jgi:hypothetical protein